MDFKARLYEAYSTQQVQVRPEALPDSIAQRAPYLRSLFRKWVPADRSTRILDLGCGYGAVLYLLREMGYRSLRGVDTSPEQVQLAHHLNLDVECGNLHETLTAVPEGSLDVIFAFDVLEHLSRPELLQLGDLIFRALSPRGQLIVHAPNASAIFSGNIRYGDLTHELAFTRTSLRQFGNSCGLRLIAATEDSPVPHGFTSTLRWLVWKLGTFHLRLLYMAERPEPYANIILSQNLLCVFAKTGP